MSGVHIKNPFNNGELTVSDLLSKNGDRRKKESLFFRVISIFICLALISVSVYTYVFFADIRKQRAVNSRINDVFYGVSDNADAFALLRQENSDITAWLSIDNTEIDSPVCISQTDDFYNKHNCFKKKSSYGAPYITTAINLYEDENITVYGKKSGIFASLNSYKNLSFYKSHPFVKLFTKEGQQIYAVFAIVPLNKNFEKGDYSPSPKAIGDEETYKKWCAATVSKSLIISNIDVVGGRNFLTLIAEDENEGALAVICARISIDEASVFDALSAASNISVK